MSVFLILTLVTTISFSVFSCSVFAEGEETASQQEQTTEETAPADQQEQTTEEAEPADQQEQTTDETAPADQQEQTTEEAAPAAGQTDPQAGSENVSGTAEGQTAIEEMLGEDVEDAGADDVSSDPLDTGLRRQTEAPDISASSSIVMSGSTSEVVFEKHAERKMSPGKIVMLMNAMVVIDNMYNEAELNNTVEFTKDLKKYGKTFKTGESVTVGDLLSAMLVGGNLQAAEALATYSASSREIFIKEMNSKAMSLGLMDTQFSNPRGAYSTKTYSTAHDCAKIAQAAMRYQIIKDTFAKRKVDIKAVSSKGERTISFTNTNPLLTGSRQSELYNLIKGGILGEVGAPVKGVQYAGIATVDDMQLIVILMDSNKSKVAYEAKSLFEYGDTKVTRNTIVKAGKKVGTARIKGGSVTRVSAYTETKGFAYVPPEGSSDLIQTQVVIDDSLEAPLKEGAKVGEFKIFVADELKGTVDLVIKRDVPRGWWPSQYYISNFVTVLIGIFLFLLLLLILRIIYVRIRRERYRAARRERRLREIAEQQLAMEEDRRARNWTDRSGSTTQIALRTRDLREQTRRDTLREEIIAEAARTGTSPKTIMRKAAKSEKKKEAAKEKARKNNTDTDVYN